LFSFSLSFSIAEKETKNLGKKMLPRAGLRLARFFADPAHAVNGIFVQRHFALDLLCK
jgi:hypothetical protein